MLDHLISCMYYSQLLIDLIFELSFLVLLYYYFQSTSLFFTSENLAPSANLIGSTLVYS